MYTVLIAEDEMLVRLGLTASVLWEKMGMQVIADVADGQRAWELYQAQKPDILITDLLMPGLDGMELIRRIRQTGEPCAVIVVTCMERFELLHEAMELGVIAYLVKVTMTMRDIEAALVKARDSLGRPRLQEPKSAGLRMAACFEEYLTGSMPHEQLIRRGQEGGFPISPAYHLCCVQIRSHQELSVQLQKALKVMIAERFKPQQVLLVAQQGACFISLFTRTPKVHDMIRQHEDFVQYVQDHFGLRLLTAITIEPVATEVLPSRLEAICHTCATLPDGPTQLYWFDAQGHLVDDHIRAEFEHLREVLWQVSDFSFAMSAVNRTYALEDAFFSGGPLFPALAQQLASILWEKAGTPGEQRASLAKGLSACVSADETLQYLCRHGVERLHSYRQEIRLIIAAVVRHPEVDLPLRNAAQLAALHPQYLSSLFKKEVGVSYTEFVCTIRIMAAKRILLNRDRSVQQVAEALGFSDAAYFCRKFKQLTGKTPAQWRRSSSCVS